MLDKAFEQRQQVMGSGTRLRMALEAEGRPARYLESAQARGLGISDLPAIEVVSIGIPWLDI